MEIARSLIERGCIKLSPKSPFTYSSGLKGPIYCDNRLALTHVDFREKLIESFLEVIKNNSFQFDLIAGIATSGIPFAAFIADRLKLPMIYVRPKAKAYGKMNQVEGDYKVNQSVILIEDLVNQGSSLAEAMVGIKNAGLLSSQCLCIVDYQMNESLIRLQEFSVTLNSLTNFEHIIKAAVELNLIDTEGRKYLMDWHDNPKEWSKLF